MTKFILKKGREESLLRFHPWVFSGAVGEIEGDDPSEGQSVCVCSYDGTVLGCGHFQRGSIIVRILSFGTPSLPEDFYFSRLSECLQLRRSLGLTDSGLTNCYRLVHGEGDNLPGLVIDYYDGVCVLQAHSAGMFVDRHLIAQALERIYGGALKAVYDKSSGTAPFKAGLELGDGYLSGAAEAAAVKENGYSFMVDWETGQKTGFFLDQRENRALVESYSKGRRVLNLFCYTGGFSVYALGSGAVSVDSVDSSATAMKMVDKNVALNGLENSHTSYCCDAIDFLRDSQAGKYDLIIVDPPAFAKHRESVSNALRAYQRLNACAIEKVAKGGIIFTFSCSQAVDRQAFSLAVFTAAAKTGRKVRILHRLSQPADHPVNIYHPEGEYLKGLVLYVE